MNWNWISRRGSAPSARSTRRSFSLRAEQLEDRSTPAVTFTPNTFGGGSFTPFANFNGQVQVASGDVNGDGVDDIITAQGTGAGSGSRISIYDGAAARFAGQAVLISDFFAYSNVPGPGQAPGFAGGVFVATGDFNGDGFDELVTSTGAGGGGHVKVFDFHDPATGAYLANSPIVRTSFVAYPGFAGDVRVAVVPGGAGQAPVLVTASGAGTTDSDVRVYNNVFNLTADATGFVTPAAQMMAFPGFLGGVSIAGGTGANGAPVLFIAPNTASPLVSTFNLTGTGTGAGTGTFAFTPGTTFSTGTGSPTGIRFGAADINGDGITDVLTSFSGVNGVTGFGPISALSLAGGTPTSLLAPDLTGFNGFGFFGNTWLGSSSFTSPALATTNLTTAAALAGTNLTGTNLNLGSTFNTGSTFATTPTFASTPTFTGGTPTSTFNTGLPAAAFTPTTTTTTMTPIF